MATEAHTEVPMALGTCPGIWGRVKPPARVADARHYGRREPPGATERPAASWASPPPLEVREAWDGEAAHRQA